MILPIRLYGDPVLRTKARTVTDFSTIPKLAEDMLETMYEAKGVGLAAPQIGQGIRMFVAAEYSDEEQEGEESELKSRVLNEYVMVNPTLEVLDATLVGVSRVACRSHRFTLTESHGFAPCGSTFRTNVARRIRSSLRISTPV
jgi:hypothetical protein